jgi:hypothetical protein
MNYAAELRYIEIGDGLIIDFKDFIQVDVDNYDI